ncbi:hypothetical protein B0H17DRAFT_1133010 [Mycena rosella]|uniref:Uncharacterized protein n=1 Tax=Mycena rosella TaxID=1033263 RepID=A0AAD7DJT2_MYCRO|nr:hypothetical protein B0H17DRAFT_1133010 [Mycena rosella]
MGNSRYRSCTKTLLRAESRFGACFVGGVHVVPIHLPIFGETIPPPREVHEPSMIHRAKGNRKYLRAQKSRPAAVHSARDRLRPVPEVLNTSPSVAVLASPGVCDYAVAYSTPTQSGTRGIPLRDLRSRMGTDTAIGGRRLGTVRFTGELGCWVLLKVQILGMYMGISTPNFRPFESRLLICSLASAEEYADAACRGLGFICPARGQPKSTHGAACLYRSPTQIFAREAHI